MMNDLVAYEDENSLIPDVMNPFAEDKETLALLEGGDFLPRLQLFISNSDAVKAEKIPMNHYGLVKGQDIIPLGKEVDIAIIAYRPRAIDASDKNNVRVSSIPTSDLFREIKDRQDNTKNSGCLYGPEFLVWVPSQEKFATFLCGGRSTRNEARKINALMGKPATLKSRFVDNGTFTWNTPIVTQCTTPFMVPSREEINRVAEEFLHPKEIMGAEKVETSLTRAR